jgi:uncharacterized protein (TIGR02646 family)
MIRLDRSTLQAPAALTTNGGAELSRLRGLIGTRALTSDDFKRSVYAAPAVQELLWASQHHKCCFCEKPVERAYASVEHFRPKTIARNADRSTSVGYWWLAYAIENLFYACMNCNGPKNDWFPLRRGTPRLAPEQRPWAVGVNEQPLLIDPSREDPEEHLTFVRHPVHRGWRIAGRTTRGEETIRRLTLDRDDLDDLRDKHLKAMEPALPILHRAKATHPDDHRAYVQAVTSPGAAYSLFTRSVLRAEGLLPT